MLQGTTHQKIRSVAIWFYIIAAFQMVAAFSFWSRASAYPALAQAAILFVGLDVVIGLIFIVLGYFAGKREPWAFVVGLFLYAIRALLQFFQFFSPIALIIRAFLLFRMYQGLQACLDAKRAEALTKLQNVARRPLEVTPAQPQTTPVAWSPARPVRSAQSENSN